MPVPWIGLAGYYEYHARTLLNVREGRLQRFLIYCPTEACVLPGKPHLRPQAPRLHPCIGAYRDS